jgi:hypothetical protein
MARLLISFLFLVLFPLSAFGQTKQAQKIDEFWNIPCNEYLARADMMMIAQNDNPAAKIYVVVYEGNQKGSVYKNGNMTYRSVLPKPGLAKVVIESMKARLRKYKKPLDNYVFVNGGFREDFWVEIWLVPPGAESPKPTPTLKKIKYRKGKATGFCLDCC